MSKPTNLTLSLVFLFVVLSGNDSIDALPLQVGFYKGKCGEADVEDTVAQLVKTKFMKDPTITAALLRIQFHDCFVNGCDASILLDGEASEKTAGTNMGLRGFDVIDAIKETLEANCPGVVSCADIISLATRDAVILSGGPPYIAETGRRDGNISLRSLVDLNIPNPDVPVSQSIEMFAKKGIDSVAMTYLLGAHTVGIANCSFFQNRLYNFNGTGKPDPTMSKELAATLRTACPENTTFDHSVHLDRNSSSRFTVDNSYYKQILLNRGVLKIDQEIALHPSTQSVVHAAAESVSDFTSLFSDSMVKLGVVDVLTGTLGEIRSSCRAVNSKKI